MKLRPLTQSRESNDSNFTPRSTPSHSFSQSQKYMTNPLARPDSSPRPSSSKNNNTSGAPPPPPLDPGAMRRSKNGVSSVRISPRDHLRPISLSRDRQMSNSLRVSKDIHSSRDDRDGASSYSNSNSANNSPRGSTIDLPKPRTPSMSLSRQALNRNHSNSSLSSLDHHPAPAPSATHINDHGLMYPSYPSTPSPNSTPSSSMKQLPILDNQSSLSSSNHNDSSKEDKKKGKIFSIQEALDETRDSMISMI